MDFQICQNLTWHVKTYLGHIHIVEIIAYYSMYGVIPGYYLFDLLFAILALRLPSHISIHFLTHCKKTMFEYHTWS